MRTVFKAVLASLFLSVPAPGFLATIPEMESAARQNKDYRIYYNLGVSYINSGDRGRAVLNLKRAYSINPSDKDVNRLLGQLRDGLGVPPLYFELSPLETVILFPFNILSINGSLVLGMALFIAGTACLSWMLSGLNERFRLKIPPSAAGKVRAASMTVIALGVIYLLASLVRYNFLFSRNSAVVVRDSAILERPLENSSRLGGVQPGTEIVIKKSDDGYFLVNTVLGQEGWISGTNVERVWNGEGQ